MFVDQCDYEPRNPQGFPTAFSLENYFKLLSPQLFLFLPLIFLDSFFCQENHGIHQNASIFQD